MSQLSRCQGGGAVSALAWLAALQFGAPAAAQTAPEPPAYHRIAPTMADRTIALSGHDLTIDQVIQVARYGAKVDVTPEAKQHMADAYGLLLEGSTEGIAIYWFNRGAGGRR